MDDINELDQAWLKDFYQRTTSQCAATRTTFVNTHNWIITLAIGGITAFLAFKTGTFSYPNEASFVAILAMVPLVFRFFTRSCLEYTLFHRWVAIRNAMDAYYAKQELKSIDRVVDDDYLKKIIETYYFGTTSAKPLQKMVKDNLMLAFLWPFLLLIFVVVIGIIYQEKTNLVIIAMVSVTIFMGYEIVSFAGYHRFKYSEVK